MNGFEITSPERRPDMDCLERWTGLRLPPLRGARAMDAPLVGASQRLVRFLRFLIFVFAKVYRGIALSTRRPLRRTLDWFSQEQPIHRPPRCSECQITNQSIEIIAEVLDANHRTAIP